MLVNLINTILIACGMAVNTTNFNSVEKPTRRNAVDTINITEKYTKIAEYDYTYNNDWYMVVDKYYLGQVNITPNYVNAYFNISNTSYRHGQINNQINRQNEFIYEFYTITSYYNTAVQFTLETELETSATNPLSVSYKLYKTEVSPSNVIDLTLNESTVTTINTYLDSIPTNDIMRSYEDTITPTTPTDNIVVTTDTIRIEPNESVNIVFRAVYRGSTNRFDEVEPYEMTINGELYVEPINVQVIDVPGLMFTVLTLPFSFITQAFNLTIFPGTPYQINFTNLFLTVIAIFVLLWLIKHIFK